MNNMTMLEGIALICSVVATGAGGIVWVVSAMMKPLKVTVAMNQEQMVSAIDRNTEALTEIKTLMREHETILENHHTRLTVIETRHE